MNNIPVNEKYTLSVKEAAQYFRIGEKKLRNIANLNPNARFVLWNGTRLQIKREEFERFIDNTNTI